MKIPEPSAAFRGEPAKEVEQQLQAAVASDSNPRTQGRLEVVLSFSFESLLPRHRSWM